MSCCRPWSAPSSTGDGHNRVQMVVLVCYLIAGVLLLLCVPGTGSSSASGPRP
jgi:hypothetical protein